MSAAWEAVDTKEKYVPVGIIPGGVECNISEMSDK